MPPPVPDTSAALSLDEAITALLDEYELEDFLDYFADEARQDPKYSGLSDDHPRVIRFKQVCAALRAAQRAPEEVSS
jgi:hypothetical protein